MDLISSTQRFTIDELPFVIAVERNKNSEDLSMKSSETKDIDIKAEKNEKEAEKKPQKKQLQFTDTPQEFIGQPQQQQMREMKSTLEKSSSAVQGTAESSTMLKTYMNQQNN